MPETSGVRGHIPKIEPPHSVMDEEVSFSFKYLAHDSNPKFLASECDSDYFCALLSTIKNLSRSTVHFLCYDYDSNHSHQLNFEHTSEANGFGLEEQIEPEYPWQFSLAGHPTWRVYGFFIGSIFYVVWLDRLHRLHPKVKT
jgi:hypothetical protein